LEKGRTVKTKLSDKAKNIISTIAPTLGALGGPLGAMAGNVISAALGDGDINKVLIEQKPETLLALRKAEQEFELKLEELGVEKERIAMADRASAREMAKVNMVPQMVLSGVFVVGYFSIFWLLLYENIELNIRQATMVNVLMGVLTAGVIKIMDFWFGSTAGSQAKSVMLANSKPADA
jgi:hypothetical protein